MSDVIEFEVKLVDGNPMWMPTKAHETDAGFDLRARSFTYADKDGNLLDEPGAEAWVLYPNEPVLVKTGVFLGLQPGWEAQIRPRSGLALKQGITVVNAPGTVDAGYRNEVGVILMNTSKHNRTINIGDRIAQMVIKRVPMVRLNAVSELDATERGLNGYGSTGQ